MEPLSIYCDWALHDELGDDVRLTEEMTLGVLDTLERWRADHGVGFDYYLLDAFWFEEPGDYRGFNPETWPNGFGPARARMDELGLKPGLWLDTTGGRVRGHEPWADSLDVHTNWTYCLFDGPYGQGLLDAMLHACAGWGVRLFKFDFANFRGVTERFRHLSAGEVYARNVEAFNGILGKVKETWPGVVVLAYNGFVHLPGFIDDTTGPVVPGISPAWLEHIDYLYSGDPRPADLPCTSFRRAVDMYQDHMVAKFLHSGIPADRVDDHGCMVGNTNTIYYLGKRGWRRSWVMTLARGSRKAHFYGDVHLLDDADVEFLGKARELFFDLYRHGAQTMLVGGIPCHAPGHGFLTGNGADGLLAVVNGSALPLSAELDVAGLGEARALFHDEGVVPEIAAEDGRLAVRLAPEQMVLIGLGLKATEECALGPNADGDAVASEVVELPLEFGHEGGTVAASVAGADLAEACETGFDTLRLSFTFRRKGHAQRGLCDRDHVLTQAVPITVEADGRPVEPTRLVPDVKVWSGCSWVTGLYPLVEIAASGQVRLAITVPDAEVDVTPTGWIQKGG